MSELIPVVDGHNDLPWQLRQIDYDLDRCDIAVNQPQLHTDLDRIAAGGLRAQFWSVYVPCSFTGADAVTATLEQIDAVYAVTQRYPDRLRLATTAAELSELLAGGADAPVASLMGAEGGHCIDDSLGVLRMFHRLGVRYLTLTHNDNTGWADSATDTPVHGGLTDRGREIVVEMNRLGMMVDLSHVAPSTMRDAIAASTAPVIFSHSSCRAVNDHPRNVPDDMMAAAAAGGGTVMITFVPQFISPAITAWRSEVAEQMTAGGLDPDDDEVRGEWVAAHARPMPTATVDDVVVHVEHAREIAGIDHIGLGGDYDGIATTPDGLPDVSSYPTLLDALADRGWSADDLAKLGHRNITRTFAAVEEVARAAG